MAPKFTAKEGLELKGVQAVFLWRRPQSGCKVSGGPGGHVIQASRGFLGH